MASYRKVLPGALGIIAASLLALQASPAFALSQEGLVSGGSIWLESTIAVALVFVTAMAFSLQIARGYFIRILNKFTLRLGADIWWLTYVLMRDSLIFMSFVMGLLVFFPGTFLDYPMAVPFMPLSVVLFGVALVTKLYFDADDDRNVFRAVTGLVFGGAVLWIFGTVFVTETPLALSPLPPGVSGSSGLWFSVYNTFSSTTNLGLAMGTFYVTLAMLGVITIFGLAHPLLHSRVRRLKSTAAPSAEAPARVPLPSVSSIDGSSTGVRTEGRVRTTAEVPDSMQMRARERPDYIA